MYVHILLVVVVAVLAKANPTWTVDDSLSAGVMVGIGAADDSHAVAGTCSQSEGAEPSFYDGSWTKTRNLASGLVMDIAASAKNAVTVAATFAGLQVSSDQGQTWAAVPNVLGLSQSVNPMGSNGFGAAGQWLAGFGKNFGGVLYSADGETWATSEIEGGESIRYGAYPSKNTWFVTAGMWDTSDNANSTIATVPAKADFTLTSKLRMGSGKVTLKAKDEVQGWWGKIWMTTDAGKSWSNVFNTPVEDQYYFNAISCGSESNCIAVGEGIQGSSPYVCALMTKDGGNTWTKTFESTDHSSLMGAVMTSETEGWITPLAAGFSTDFYHTTDGGATWTNEQTLKGCYSTYLDARDGLTMSTCLNKSGSKASVAFYA